MAKDQANVERVVEGVSFPASRVDLVTKARECAAPEDVVRALERLPQDRFNTPGEVLDAWPARR